MPGNVDAVMKVMGDATPVRRPNAKDSAATTTGHGDPLHRFRLRGNQGCPLVVVEGCVSNMNVSIIFYRISRKLKLKKTDPMDPP
ncbi:hypothetical protein RNI52_01675 [Labrys neptuniae]|uniref:hypothetical protein n=1 Tax=Labrys neptuniae TaxID=376174 RepID=UPI00288E128A|nr:hypothetical protein [Labrys neptuniae]MDT3376021.1 hypothetical protein [Labrys neptuniae]